MNKQDFLEVNHSGTTVYLLKSKIERVHITGDSEFLIVTDSGVSLQVKGDVDTILFP
jgi:hypothetical protein